MPRIRPLTTAVAALVVAGVLAGSPIAGAVVGPLRSAADASETAVRVRPPGPQATSVETETVELINLERSRRGLPPLRWHDQAAAAAAEHAVDMAARQVMSHIGSDGSDAGDRLVRHGYTWRGWGENVAYGQSTPAEVVAAWMASPGHRAVMLSGSFSDIGIGAAVDSRGLVYWSMVVATR